MDKGEKEIYRDKFIDKTLKIIFFLFIFLLCDNIY